MLNRLGVVARKYKSTWIAAGVVLVVLGGVLPRLASSPNCGGNTAALFRVGEIHLYLQMGSNDGGHFDPTKLSMDQRKELERLSRYSWTGDAPYLIPKSPVKLTGDPSQIVVICGKQFDNVPQPTIWNGYQRTPAYAVAYGDGSTALLTEAEFKRIPLQGFVDLKDEIVVHSVNAK